MDRSGLYSGSFSVLLMLAFLLGLSEDFFGQSGNISTSLLNFSANLLVVAVVSSGITFTCLFLGELYAHYHEAPGQHFPRASEQVAYVFLMVQVLIVLLFTSLVLVSRLSWFPPGVLKWLAS